MSILDLATQIFGAKDHLSVGQECVRAVVVFLYGLALVRLAGRRAFGKWAALDIVVSIVVGSNLSRALTGGAPFLGTLAATFVLMLLHWLLAHAAARSQLVSKAVEGEPIELAREGAHDVKARKIQAVSLADVQEALRQQGLEQVQEARRVVLEPSGKINVIKKDKQG